MGRQEGRCTTVLSCHLVSVKTLPGLPSPLAVPAGDSPAGHPPCYDHGAGDGGRPALPAHAPAGQDPGGARTAAAAHTGDQPQVRLLGPVSLDAQGARVLPFLTPRYSLSCMSPCSFTCNI